MRYAIYYTWKDDNSRDTFNADNAKERDMNIRNLISRNKFKVYHTVQYMLMVNMELERKYYERDILTGGLHEKIRIKSQYKSTRQPDKRKI